MSSPSPDPERDPEALLTPTEQLAKLGIVESLSRDGMSAVADDAPASAVSAGGFKATLIVVRGEKIDMAYPLYPGKNYLGRTDEKPVDVDLECQEPADRVWTSRQHAVIHLDDGVLSIEDLNSLNGTFVNRTRVHPGQVRALAPNDVIQVGTVQLRLVVG
jgi:hypothetical protein